MSTLSFQDYVRNRMLKRRKASLAGRGRSGLRPPDPRASASTSTSTIRSSSRASARASPAEIYAAAAASHEQAKAALAAAEERRRRKRPARPAHGRGCRPARAAAPAAIVADPIREADAAGDARRPAGRAALDEGPDRGALQRPAFMEKLQRRPGEARLTQKLLDCGFSPALIKKLAAGLTDDAGDETAWATQVLERNLRAGEADSRHRLPGRRVRPDRRHRRRQDDDHRQDRRRLRRPPRRLQPRPDHARRLPRRRPRAAARLRPHPRRAGAHRARPRLARGPARAARRQEDGADRHRRHGAARQPHPRAARHALAPQRSSACWSSTPRRRARRSRTCWSPTRPRAAPASC